MERIEERGHRRLAAIEALRDLEPRRDVVPSERERLAPVPATALQVGAQRLLRRKATSARAAVRAWRSGHAPPRSPAACACCGARVQ
jgi:hypothetical protein